MTELVFRHKIFIIIGLILVFAALAFSCGIFGAEENSSSYYSGCNLIMSLVNPHFSKDSLQLFGGLVLLMLASFTMVRMMGNLFAEDPPQLPVVLNYVQKKQETIFLWLQELFSRGIIHSKIYAQSSS